MLGSLSEADDAVQETWLRLSRSEANAIENLGGWLTTVVARVCLNLLRSHETRREETLGLHMPDPIISREGESDPERAALLADAVGLALLVVLDALDPAERLAFVLHDMFAVPFDEIAQILERSPVAARQLASRARRRVRVSAPRPTADHAHQRAVVDAFFAAARDGDFEALVAVLHPDVLLRSDGGAVNPNGSVIVQGAGAVARRALMFAQAGPYIRPALINGSAGIVAFGPDGRPFSVMGFIVIDGQIGAIDALVDPVRLRVLDVSMLV
jgi:RNA polymerase sigma-70 factor (ECF subfamily)